MRYKVRHQTTYLYSEDVSLSHSLLTCQPRTTPFQQCLSSHTWIEPNPTYWEKRRDALGNWIGYFSLEERHRKLTIVCRSLVEVTGPTAQNDPGLSWNALELTDPELYQFLYPTPWTDCQECKDYAAASFSTGATALEAVLQLTGRIHQDFRYLPGSTVVSTPIAQVMKQRQGVCQDFAHVLVSCLRHFGLPARYVSGYLLTTPPAGQARLVGADASHAWASAWLPGLGWVDFDPTNNCLCDERHVVLAWGRDYQEVAPVRGVVLGGGRQQIQVGVDVIPE
ncbi:MAG: transglutaminase family protein [Candidatus Eremiobacteraeota bacterium]|nr:transglutaminase family protein [Candidatus Eremiobacteraeota bacterium]MCW5872490.1 transglutaminase family protein [Candidatus Eremiobacteraeota bacterium]